ncbi:hypothetical protein P7C70_g2687, partial [Phenoliferia sp. Uapishka_3]
MSHFGLLTASAALRTLSTFVIASVLLSIIFCILASLLIPGLSVRRAWLGSLRRISWRSTQRGKDPQATLQLDISLLGWTLVWRKRKDQSGGHAPRLVLRAHGVNLKIPRAWLVAERTPANKSAPSSTRTSKGLKEQGTAKKETALPKLLPKLLPFLSWISIEIEATIQVEDILSLSTTLRFGIHSARTSTAPTVATWLTLSNLLIHELHKADKELTAASPWPAISIREPVVIKASAPLGLNDGKSGAALKIAFGRGAEGVHVRVHELKRILRSFEEIELERKLLSPVLSSSPPLPEKEETESCPGSPPPTTTISPLATALLSSLSLELSLPLFLISAHYTTPGHILAISPNRPLPETAAFALTVNDVNVKVNLGGTSDDLGKAEEEHRAFFGRGRKLVARAAVSWKEIAGRIRVDGTEEDILPSSAKAFSIGPSSLNLTTTWAPPSLSAILTPPLSPCAPQNYNEPTLILSSCFGSIRGHFTFETYDSALRIFSARPRPRPPQPYGPPPSSPNFNPETARPPKFLKGLPQVHGSVRLEGGEVRIQAPALQSRNEPSNKRNGAEYSEDQFYREWMSPDVFCLTLPGAEVAFGGEYQERSLRRTDGDRRRIKRLSRKAEDDELQQEDHGADHVKELVEKLGVPPPPPITSRRSHNDEYRVASTSEVEIWPISYHTRFSATVEILNVFILATNDGTADPADATSWLDDKHQKLPSDPIRFDILAVGPLEVLSSTVLLGTEGGKLDPGSRNREIGILVDTIGVDLWRPPVMSALRDFLDSEATARETSSLRPASGSSSDRPTTHAPLVDILPTEIAVYIAIASLDVRVAGSDPKNNDVLACRGIAAHSDAIIVEYILQHSLHPGGIDYPARASLTLREDIRVEANANVAAEGGRGSAALVKVAIRGLHVDPVVDARSSKGHTRKHSTMGFAEEGSGGDWEMKGRAEILSESKHRRKFSIVPVRKKAGEKGLVAVPDLDLRVKIARGKGAEEEASLDDVTVAIEASTLSFKFELFSIYLCLVAIATVKSLAPRTRLSSPPASPPTPASPPVRAPKRPSPAISLRADVADFHLFLTLPNNVPLYIHTRRLGIQHSPVIGVIAESDMLLLAGTSPTVRGQWDDIFRLRIMTITIKRDEESGHPLVVGLVADSARLRIPFRYVFSQIIDNAVNLVKALKQLIHQHIKGGLDWILEPEVEEAKKLPKIDLNLKMFAVEIQDDPFETRLNIIWRAGYEEQIARLERAAAFEAKVEAINKADAQGDEESETDEEEQSTAAGGRRHKLSGKHTITIAEARRDLLAYNSSHWVKRMRNAVAEQGRREEANTRRLYGARRVGDNKLPIDLLPTSRSAPLARAMFWDLRFVITKPAFPVADFLFDVGKGLPRETQFTLLIPLHFSWKMDQARVQLRDYPLPLIHVPPMPSGGGSEHASWECEADLVIAEELGGHDAIRRVPCAVVPARHTIKGGALYTIVVPRSAMTVKTYATPVIKIRSPHGTRIGWGNSIQPAIQDVTKVLDTLSKASPDPSERIGFWDKIRLQFHWRVKVLFEGEGPVHFHIKGTRDPYSVTGFGAGFVKSWSGNVKFFIGLPNADREFFQIESDRYILGIPNLRSYVDAAASGLARDPTEGDDRATQHSGVTGGETGGRAFSEDADHVKICAKFINGVRWGMGAVLERACTVDCPKELCNGKSAFHRQCRNFDFIPHWEVHTKTEAAIKENGEVDDSFAGFRSDFIHFSISLTSPLTLSLPSCAAKAEDQRTDADGCEGYNSLHFSPQAATHFWAWWRLFDGTMSLPIRQGKLFPSAQPPSKKFGKHCATIKYRFSLAPLFIAHTYRQELMADWENGETTMVGLKGKIGRFNVDLHQREQEQVVQKPNSKETKVVLRKSFYQAEVDLDGVDLRVLSACFKEPEKEYFSPEDAEEDEDVLPANDDYSVAEEDFEWIDLDDYVDAAYTIPDRNPRLRVIPFTVCPRFTYYRQTDTTAKDPSKSSTETPSGDNDTSTAALKQSRSKFGHEPSHTCLMGCATDTITVQIDSAKSRLAELETELQQSTSNYLAEQSRRRIDAIRKIIDRLMGLREGHKDPLDADQDGMDDPFDSRPPRNDAPYNKAPPIFSDGDDTEGLPNVSSTLHQEWGDWTNRYMVHNPTIQLSNTSREVLLKYYYSQRERRGFMYHLSAKAIKFIRELAKENARKKKEKDQPHRGQAKGRSQRTTTNHTLEDTQKTNRLLDGVSGGFFYAPNESEDGQRHAFGDALDVDPEAAAESLPEMYDLLSGHLCIFIKPQISLKSDIDDKSSITLTAFRAQLKSFQVVDTRVPDDPVNSQVLSQTFATLDGLQAFYPRDETEKRAGAAFVPLETLVDLSVEPWGFDRVVPRTSAAMRYDKFNQLRMSSKTATDDGLGLGPQDSHFQTGTDRVSVECDKFSVSANPDHFAAVYNVVTDLLLYSDPLQKSRNKKLEELVFTQDFSNLSGVSNKVAELQQRIRELVDLGQQYQVHLDELDEEGRLDLFASRMEFAKLSAELNIYVQAISRAQNFNGVTSSAASKTAGVQFEARASELVWHMLEATGVPFAKFSVRGVEFSWISKQDSSISNRLVIRDLRALNSSPEQVFAEIIAKHHHGGEHELAKVDIFAAILWNSLAPVGGISIVEQFELHLHPIRLQLEHRVGRKILDYVFAQRKHSDEEPPEVPPKPARSTLAPLGSSIMNKSSESLALSTRAGQNGHTYPNRPRSFLDSASVTPNRSSVAISNGSESQSRLRKVASVDVLRPQDAEGGLDADEMRKRASLYRTFILVDFSPTVLYLTYRSEKEDHSRLPDIYDLTYRTPSIQYRSKTWSFLDLLDELKKDTIKSIWSQKGALIGQLLSTAHRRLPMQDARMAANTAKKSIKSRFHIGSHRTPSPISASTGPLRIVTQPSMDDSRSVLNRSSPTAPTMSSSNGSTSSPHEMSPRTPHILESVPYSLEPDEMSVYSPSRDSSSSNGHAGGVDELPDELILGVVESHTIPAPHRSLSQPPPRHAASLPPLSPNSGDSSPRVDNRANDLTLAGLSMSRRRSATALIMYNSKAYSAPSAPSSRYHNPPDSRDYEVRNPRDHSDHRPYNLKNTFEPEQQSRYPPQNQRSQQYRQDPYDYQSSHRAFNHSSSDGQWRRREPYQQSHNDPPYYDQYQNSTNLRSSAPSFQPPRPVYSHQWEDLPPRAELPPRPRARTPPRRNSPSTPSSPPRSPFRPNEAPSTPARRQKIARTDPSVVLTPSPSYLAATSLPVLTIVPSIFNPHLLVLDLNNCILFRRERSANGSKIPIPRPYLASFLQYVCGPERSSSVDGAGEEVGRRFSAVVYSSARSYNVLSMLSALDLVPAARAAVQERGKPWVANAGEPLAMVFSREMMGLNSKEFEQNVETVKDLEAVWTALDGRWGPERTILLDDEAFKASLQPYNHLPIPPFFVNSTDIPQTPLRTHDKMFDTPSLIYPSLPNDTSLLTTAYIVSVLRTKSNVASFIRGGGLDVLNSLGEYELIKRGRELLENLGIEIKKDWDPDWWSKCL